jgi:hypothetical protein
MVTAHRNRSPSFGAMAQRRLRSSPRSRHSFRQNGARLAPLAFRVARDSAIDARFRKLFSIMLDRALTFLWETDRHDPHYHARAHLGDVRPFLGTHGDCAVRAAPFRRRSVIQDSRHAACRTNPPSVWDAYRILAPGILTAPAFRRGFFISRIHLPADR